MFDKKYEDRLRIWHQFRSSLETSESPIQDTVDFYKRAPMVSMQVDPWNSSTWLNPWELLYENQYCDFSKLLAIFYTLQLTDRFSSSRFEIHICTDRDKSEVRYLLNIDDVVLDCHGDNTFCSNGLSSSLYIEKQYTL
jgi:hypothetical protein